MARFGFPLVEVEDLRGRLSGPEARLKRLRSQAEKVAPVKEDERYKLFEQAFALRREIAFSNPLLDFQNVIFINRCKGVGLMDATTCRAYGVTVPTLRAAGVAYTLPGALAVWLAFAAALAPLGHRSWQHSTTVQRSLLAALVVITLLLAWILGAEYYPYEWFQ